MLLLLLFGAFSADVQQASSAIVRLNPLTLGYKTTSPTHSVYVSLQMCFPLPVVGFQNVTLPCVGTIKP